MLDCCREKNEFFSKLNPEPKKTEDCVGFEKATVILGGLSETQVRKPLLNGVNNMMVCMFACKPGGFTDEKSKFSEMLVHHFERTVQFKGHF
jgi:hypothetical protein